MRLAVLALMGVSATALAAASEAQVTTAAMPRAASTVEELVVTAQKREENI